MIAISKVPQTPRWFPLWVGVGMALVTFSVWWVWSRAEEIRFNAVLNGHAQEIRERVEQNLEERTHELDLMARRWEYRGFLPTWDEFDSDAWFHIYRFEGAQAIAWVSSDLKIQRMVPGYPTELSVALPYWLDKNRQSILELALEYPQAAATHLVSSPDGGVGFLAVRPVRLDDQSFAFLVLSFEMGEALSAMLHQKIPAGFSAAVLKDENPVYQFDPDGKMGNETKIAQTVSIDLYGQDWGVWLSPERDFLEQFPLFPMVFLLAGMVFSFLFSWALHLVKMARSRARELHALNRSLSSEVAQKKWALTELQVANRVVENSATVLVRVEAGQEWPVVLVSQNMDQFGYSSADLQARRASYRELIHSEDRFRVEQERVEAAARGENSLRQEYQILTPNGGFRWVEDLCSLERDSLGNLTYYEGLLIDISERKEAVQILRSKVQELEFLNGVMMEREERIIKLKEEVRRLKGEISPSEPYQEAAG